MEVYEFRARGNSWRRARARLQRLTFMRGRAEKRAAQPGPFSGFNYIYPESLGARVNWFCEGSCWCMRSRVIKCVPGFYEGPFKCCERDGFWWLAAVYALLLIVTQIFCSPQVEVKSETETWSSERVISAVSMEFRCVTSVEEEDVEEVANHVLLIFRLIILGSGLLTDWQGILHMMMFIFALISRRYICNHLAWNYNLWDRRFRIEK